MCYPKHFGSLVCHNWHRYALFNRRFSTLKYFLWDTASALPVYGSCSELRASSKGVYFLPFCINSELLFLLPQHSHATTPNTVVFAENHSCAKSVTVFTFLRKDVLPQMESRPHYWRTNHLRHPNHHRSQHRHPWGTHWGVWPPRGDNGTRKPSWRTGAEGCSLLLSHVKCLCLESERKTFFLFPLPRQLSSALAHFCAREGELEVYFLYFYSSSSSLLPCPATLDVPQDSDLPVATGAVQNGETGGGSRESFHATKSSVPAANHSSCPQPQPLNQLSCHWESGTNKQNKPRWGSGHRKAFKIIMKASDPYSKVICGILELEIHQKLGEIPGWDRVSGGETTARIDLSREGEGKSKNLKREGGCMRWARAHMIRTARV